MVHAHGLVSCGVLVSKVEIPVLWAECISLRNNARDNELIVFYRVDAPFCVWCVNLCHERQNDEERQNDHLRQNFHPRNIV